MKLSSFLMIVMLSLLLIESSYIYKTKNNLNESIKIYEDISKLYKEDEFKLYIYENVLKVLTEYNKACVAKLKQYDRFNKS